jgi:predicted permease
MRLSRWIYTLPLRLRSLFRRNQTEQELDEELRSHLEQAIEFGVSRGMDREQARREALRSFQGIEQRKEECRDNWGVRAIDDLCQDVRYALRTLRKSPGFTTVAIVSLALGIGANTAVFSLMDVLFIRPLPVKQPHQLALLKLTSPEFTRGPQYSFSYPLFRQLQQRNGVYSGFFAWSSGQVQTPEAREMALLRGVYASGEYFETLGVPPVIGRTLGPEDDDPAGGRNGAVAVIGDGLWRRKYAANPRVLGQSIVINGIPVTIVGVMPAGFSGTEVGYAGEIWMPLNLARQTGDNANCFSMSSCWFIRVMARLRPGITRAQADANLRVISPASLEATVEPGVRADRKAAYLARKLESEPGKSGYTRLRRQVGNPLQVLMALVGLVLLIACANMANLLTARASARFREVGVRLALGADRLRVIRQFLTESVLLAIGGAIAGFLFALWSTRALILVLSTSDNPVILDLHPDGRVLFFSTALALLAGVAFGLGPALYVTRFGAGAALKERARNVRGGEERLGFGRFLLGAQVALSIVLLAAAGLFAGTLVRLMHVNTGFDPTDLTVVSLVNSHPPLQEPQAIQLFGRLVSRVRAIPGVESATVIWPTPLSDGGWNDLFDIPARTDLSEEQRVADVSVMGTGFTKTMRVPLLAGRDFNESDATDSEKVALITENAARRWFPNGGALGAHITFTGAGPRIRIIGITCDYRYLNLREDLPLTVFIPYTQNNSFGFVAMRTKLPVNATYAAFRAILHEEAPAMPIGTIRTMKQQIDESLSAERLTAYLSVFIGALALLLTSVGLYGILAYSVSRRTGEIGIRMALGAQRRSMVWLVIRQVMAHITLGAAIGIAAVLMSSHVVKKLLYDVSPNDPATIAAAAGALILVCILAAAIPARRATQLDPMQALREE